MPTLNGTNGDDILVGTSDSDTIYGESGNDSIDGADGDDGIQGGTGDDIIQGGNGNDWMTGNEGQDVLFGGDGNDTFYIQDGFDSADGGAGYDTLDIRLDGSATGLVVDLSGLWNGGTGSIGGSVLQNIERTTGLAGTFYDDVITLGVGHTVTYLMNIIGGGGADQITGSDDSEYIYGHSNGQFASIYGADDNQTDIVHGLGGGDYLYGNGGHDVLYGDAGNDQIFGGSGNDTIYGGDDHDYIYGEEGADQFFGGAGNDTINADLNDTILNGGTDTDLASFSSVTGGAGNTYYWSIGSGFHGGAGFASPVSIAFIGIENLAAFDGNDSVRGTAARNSIWSYDGDDILRGLGGDDYLDAGAGDDVLDGGTGYDVMAGGAGNDTYYVDAIGELVYETYNAGLDEVRSSVNFLLPDYVENLRLSGAAVVGSGNGLANTIIAGAGPATLSGGSGDDVLIGSAASDSLSGGADNDTLYGRNGNDTIHGGDGDDTLRGEVGSDILNGNAGNDLIFGDAGIDTLNGGDGDDDLRGGIQNDTLNGDAGSDVLRGEDGNDVLSGGAERDFLTGGLGNDSFVFADGDFSGVTTATADRITDFVQGQDKIRLALVDADSLTAGDQAFTFIGNSAFGNVAGQLRYEVVGTSTLVLGDTNGDGVADFAIALTGAFALLGTDFTP